MKIAVIYGSDTDNTENAANMIAEKLGISEVLNVANIDAEKMNSYDKLLCGSSTWGSGDLQDDWDSFDFDALSLSGKTMAVFGVGDSDNYSDTYCNAMGTLAENFKKAGAKLVGAVSTDGYTFDESSAVVDGKFVGLALDYDNEEDKTEGRIDAWVAAIKPEFA